jgi:glycosyltransferase involved in cell wall biosynthesis
MESKNYPLITIIIAVFNGAKTLQQCIDSITEQSYPNKQLIIIDGGSNDGTVELLQANNQSISYWISEPDAGIYNAWNKGLAIANGEWICFLGADDYFWDSSVLECMSSQLLIAPSNIRVVYGQIMLLNSNGENMYAVGKPWLKVKKCFKQIMCIPHPGLMHRYSLFEQHGKFDESFQIAGDYELLLRELRTAGAMFIPNLITIGMRQGGVSSDSENTLRALQEIRLAQKINGQKLPGWFWILAITKSYICQLLRTVQKK